jgi:azurin
VLFAHVLDGGKQLFLQIPQMVPANNIHLRVGLAEGKAQDLYITAHHLRDDFTTFPGYKSIAKTWQPAALPNASQVPAFPAPAKPNPWAKAKGETGQPLLVDAALGLQFHQKELKVKAGTPIALTFKNPDVVPHNWVLVKPNRLQAVGDLTNKLITDPEALSHHYIPESPDVLYYTDMVMPGGSFTIHIKAPEQPGRYPYLCTFPGHWAVMNGVLVVSSNQ